MQTSLTESIRGTRAGAEADRILRNCVHCGFCTATCPTYQITGDELDGPRGRIYLIKSLLEGHEVTEETRLHLDRCLGCRACETTCPSGVNYSRLLEIGRTEVKARLGRSLPDRIRRRVLRAVIPHGRRFEIMLRAGRAVRRVLPAPLRRKLPRRQPIAPWPEVSHPRKMLLLESCGQAAAAPATNAAAARVLAAGGVELARVPEAGCCGALSHHLEADDEARQMARHNIDAWWPHIESGAEAILITASGCGTMVKEYGELLADDPGYRDRAIQVAAMARDLSEAVAQEAGPRLQTRGRRPRVAFHCPCSLQHGQGLEGVVERLLAEAGFRLTSVQEPHLCCGSAGPYSLLQPGMAGKLLRRKIDALQADAPEVIATANVGCQLHLQTGTDLPVRHWIELLDEALQAHGSRP